ncbi:hypothetical protein SDC9_178673 [bioreactor metagenome]|uniref:Uncharacterized protein n=1 Tax=bioreactor metagenome TaxID=1076179 RepID=A0A645GZN6_9ZZZZ
MSVGSRPAWTSAGVQGSTDHSSGWPSSSSPRTTTRSVHCPAWSQIRSRADTQCTARSPAAADRASSRSAGASSGAARSHSGSSTALEAQGRFSNCVPAASAIRWASVKPSPRPPCSSEPSRLIQPISAMSRHSCCCAASLQERAWRARAGGWWSAKKRVADSCSICCSALSAKSMDSALR